MAPRWPRTASFGAANLCAAFYPRKRAVRITRCDAGVVHTFWGAHMNGLKFLDSWDRAASISLHAHPEDLISSWVQVKMEAVIQLHLHGSPAAVLLRGKKMDLSLPLHPHRFPTRFLSHYTGELALLLQLAATNVFPLHYLCSNNHWTLFFCFPFKLNVWLMCLGGVTPPHTHTPHTCNANQNNGTTFWPWPGYRHSSWQRLLRSILNHIVHTKATSTWEWKQKSEFSAGLEAGLQTTTGS